ncbi:hypothetical protein F0919_00715 [Taibaiella lutea]|uniref:Uncharacterized protein n=1 Tax=Taibaiella lutea TaxID=2608001 RepID=A0A5M6CP96_9BACT|nr:hypothetical protein [Taibaiella lutea]KAA5536220.1 hypothetical protein F0919_00715 [Taibaiella lutea]
MTLYNRYLNGETIQVYKDISAMGADAFLPNNFPEIKNVLTETFQRVSYNLNIIYKELKDIHYLFRTDFEYNSDLALIKPLANVDVLLADLDKVVRPFGFVPLSLKMFYKIVGSCNFSWDFDINEEHIWQFADPIQISGVDDVLEELTQEGFLDDLSEFYEEDGYIALEISADYLHKDNTSGGPAYALLLTQKPSIDSSLLNEEHDTTLIDYLRICFDNCGFPRITNKEHNNDYKDFFDKVKPQLKPI